MTRKDAKVRCQKSGITPFWRYLACLADHSFHPWGPNSRSLREIERRETGSLQFPIECRHFLRDDLFPTFREDGCLGPNIVYRCFDPIGGRGVDALNLLEQIPGGIQGVQGRSRTRSWIWRFQLL